MMYPTRLSGFFISPVGTDYANPLDVICRSYLCVADTTCECLSPRRFFGWPRRMLLTQRLIRAKFPKKCYMLIQRIAVKEFIGCVTSTPYGSIPRVSVRVVDSSRDFNSAVVQRQVRRTQIFRMLESMLPMGVAPESVVESQTRRRTRRNSSVL